MVPEYPTPLLGRDLFLHLKSCSYCSPERRCFKSHSWGQTNYFYQPAGKQLLNGRGHLWISDQRILRYQVILMENPGLTIYHLIRFLTQLPSCLPPRARAPFTLASNSEGFQEDHMGWFQKEGLIFLPGNLQWKLVNSLHATIHLGEKALQRLLERSSEEQVPKQL